MERLKRKQALLSDDKLQSHAILKEVQDSDQYAKDQFSTLQTSLEDIRSTLDSQQFQSKTLQAQEMKSYLESRLDVSKPRSDLQLESRDPILENSGNWILSDPTFESWERGNSQDRRVLFLNGSPGSGKSLVHGEFCAICQLTFCRMYRKDYFGKDNHSSSKTETSLSVSRKKFLDLLLLQTRCSGPENNSVHAPAHYHATRQYGRNGEGTPCPA